MRVGTNTESRIQQSFNLLGLCFWFFFFVCVCVCVCVSFCFYLSHLMLLFSFMGNILFMIRWMAWQTTQSIWKRSHLRCYVILITYISLYLEKCFLHIVNNSNTLLNISLKLKAQEWQRNNQYTQLEFYEGVREKVLIKTNICQILFPAFSQF